MQINLVLNAIVNNPEMLGVLIAGYVMLFAVVAVSFLNVYSADKIEFLSNTQKCVELKRRLFFVIAYSKNKRIVSKKTLVLEIIGYVVGLGTIVAFVCSLWQVMYVALVVLCVTAAVNFVYGFVTGMVLYLAKRTKNGEKEI